jgi:uncharacterized protein YoxC
MNADREWHPGWFWGAIIAAAMVLFGWFVYAGYLAWPHVAQCTGLWRAQAEVGPFLQAMPAQYNPCLTLNEFGDFLAGTFAPLAFFGLIITVIIQSRELREQRKELSHSIAVAEAQKEEMAEQADFLGKQAELMADTARLNSEQQARRDLDTLVEIVRPFIQRIAQLGNRYNDLPDRVFLREHGLRASDRLRLAINTGLSEKDEPIVLECGQRLKATALAELASIRERLGEYDRFLYDNYGFGDLVRQLQRLP